VILNRYISIPEIDILTKIEPLQQMRIHGYVLVVSRVASVPVTVHSDAVTKA
jgi:hypothetical protein